MEKEKYIRSQFSIKGLLRHYYIIPFHLSIGAGFTYVCYLLFREIIPNFTWKVFLVDVLFLVFLLCFLYVAYLYIRQLRIITITDSYIEYRYLFFPFISWKHNIDEYDKIVHVELANKGSFFEGVWLVKKGKVKMEIYKNAYENYDELIAAINLPHVRSNPTFMSIGESSLYIHGKKKVKTRQIKPKKPRDGK